MGRVFPRHNGLWPPAQRVVSRLRMAPRLGFFDDFKGSDAVLLTLSAEEAGELANQLQRFVSSSQASAEIAAEQIPGHEATLVAVRSSDNDVSGFRWLCGPSEAVEINAKLTALASAMKGHQYFDLEGSDAQLIVSVGEYAY